MRTLCILLTLLVTFYGNARTVTDSTAFSSIPKEYKANNYDFKWKQIILPASLIGLGGFALAPTKVNDWSRDLRNGITDLRGNKRRQRFDDYVQYAPMAGALFLGCTGIKSRHRFWERTLILGTSYAALGVLTKGAKICIHEDRPDLSGDDSFPSGHTARAFMGAELVRIEYGKWYGLGAYAIAGCVGFMRLYNSKHYVHDVVAGAGIGILSARIGEWSACLWQKALSRKKRKEAHVAFTPIVSPSYGGHYGFYVGCTF